MSATTTLLLQVSVILVAARACGMALRIFGQPMVIGEMVAGILLGPIVLGAWLPSLHAQLFPPDSLDGLKSLSTLGVVLFMFIVGAELRAPQGARSQLKAAGLVGLLGMAGPLVLGLIIAPWLHPRLAPAGVGLWPFSLFLAVALSITAFPVLARIIKDRDLSGTRIGQLALSAAAVVDICAWILLALVIGVSGAAEGSGGFLRMAAGLVLLPGVALLLLKPICARILRIHAPAGNPSASALAFLLVGLLVCAMAAEWLHLHAVFGAFLFGLCLPRDNRLLHTLSERIEPVAVVVLMAIFFALAGLGTTADAFSATGLAALAAILAVAVIGKIAGSTAGARLSGYGWRDSLATGSLMNARGLMELIVIKVGLDAGLIGPELFTMLLVMALATTAMTGPLVALFTGRAKHAPASACVGDHADP